MAARKSARTTAPLGQSLFVKRIVGNVIARVDARSRVTDGRQLLNVDPDNPYVVRYKRTLARHVADLGGARQLSASEMAILRHASVLQIELDALAIHFARGNSDPALLDLYGRIANSLLRQLQALGLGRRAKDVSPSLSTYLRGRANGSNDEAAQ